MRSTLVHMIIVLALGLISCREKSSDTVPTKGQYPVDIQSERHPTDWIPFDSLKVRELNSNQISLIYGQPISMKTDTLRWGENGDFYVEEELSDLFKNSPCTILHTLIWPVDSIHELKLYCLKRSEGIYIPVWGYQYNYNIIPFE